MPTVVCASGYFDPIHPGHIEYLERSKAVAKASDPAGEGRLVVIVNNDEQASMKKGKPFMPCKDRLKIVRALGCVDAAIEACEKGDRSVCQSLRLIQPDIFTNGGDQTNESIPEAKVCAEMGTKLIDQLGDKINSSSWLIAKAKGEEAVVKADPNA